MKHAAERRSPGFLSLKTLAITAAVLVVVAALVGAYVRFFPVMTWHGWKSEVAFSDVERVSALAIDSRGTLYATQEFKSGDGRIVKLVAGEPAVTVVSGLDKPDGLSMLGDELIISQEGGDFPLLKFSPAENKHVSLPFRGNNLEQIWVYDSDDNPVIYAVEDKPQGKLLVFDVNARTTSVLAEGLEEAEGVSRCPDGSILFTEKSGTVSKLTGPNVYEPIVTGLKDPGFVLCTQDGFWVTEDATNHSRLMLFENTPPYSRKIVASHLRSAQYVLELPDGSLLLVEQGRNRVLRLFKED